MNILVINGPNLNMLGIREPEIYGTRNYLELVDYIEEVAAELDVEVEVYQSNAEGFLIDRIQRGYFDGVDGIIINAGGYTHTSIAIPDAIKSVSIPTVEVHITDITKREGYRKVSFIREACVGCVMGKGFESYKEAMEFLVDYVK